MHFSHGCTVRYHNPDTATIETALVVAHDRFDPLRLTLSVDRGWRLAIYPGVPRDTRPTGHEFGHYRPLIEMNEI